MLTIEEIKTRKKLGKRKWGFSLILLLIDQFDDNLPSEAICNELSQNHQFEISPDALAHVKARHYSKVKKFMEQVAEQTLKSSETYVSQIVQKEEISTAELLYEKIYQKKNSIIEFDLGKDF
jgi:GTPase Era involved in 16S rRNA processing